MAMKLHKWEDVRARKLSAAQLRENDEWVAKEVLEMDLRQVREIAGKTQEEVAAVAKMTQGELSRAEHRSDHLMSTLERIVKALGGDLEVYARFGNKQVKLRGV